MDWILLVVFLGINGGSGAYPSGKEYSNEAACRAEMGTASFTVMPNETGSIVSTACVKMETYQNYVRCFITDMNGNDQCPYPRHSRR